MKVYLSSRYGRRAELQGYRDELRALGIEVNATWLDQEMEHGPECALRDAEDTHDADLVVGFSEPEEFVPGAQRGGRHVEVGIAWEAGVPVIIVGPEENVFHLLPSVVVVETWAEAKEMVVEAAIAEVNERWALACSH